MGSERLFYNKHNLRGRGQGCQSFGVRGLSILVDVKLALF